MSTLSACIERACSIRSNSAIHICFVSISVCTQSYTAIIILYHGKLIMGKRQFLSVYFSYRLLLSLLVSCALFSRFFTSCATIRCLRRHSFPDCLLCLLLEPFSFLFHCCFSHCALGMCTYHYFLYCIRNAKKRETLN